MTSNPTEALPRRICQLCKSEYPGTVLFCSIDGAKTIPSDLYEDESGKCIGGKFILERRIGCGGFGTIYQAREKLTNKPVAVKLQYRWSATDPEKRQLVINEARALMTVHSRHAVTLHGVGEEDERIYLVLEFVNGPNLRRWWKDAYGFEPIPPYVVIEIAEQVCIALRDIHDDGVLHRDLKPENIIIEQRGAKLLIKVVDFGIAKLTEDVSNESALDPGRGYWTLNYAAPERYDGKELDARSDLYSFGVVLYEMLTGKLPFEITSIASLIETCKRRPVPPSKIVTCLADHAGLENLVMQLLERDPARRPLSAAEVATRLSDLKKAKVPLHQRLPSSVIAGIFGTIIGFGIAIILSSRGVADIQTSDVVEHFVVDTADANVQGDIMDCYIHESTISELAITDSTLVEDVMRVDANRVPPKTKRATKRPTIMELINRTLDGSRYGKGKRR